MRDPFSPTTDISENLYIKRELDEDKSVIDFYKEFNGKDNKEQNEFLGKSIKTKNLKWFLFFLFLGLIILTARIYYLQINRGKYYSSLAKGNKTRKFVIPATRGVVFDRDGELLVKNVPRFSVFVTIGDLPAQAKERESVIQKLAKLIGTDLDEIKQFIKKQEERGMIYQPISIKDNLKYDQALRLKIAIKELAGINLEVGQQRKYLGGDNLSAIIGYVGKISEKEYEEKKGQGYLLNDIIGKAGIEYSYENKLRGANGFEEVEVDALGKRKKILSVKKTIAGNNIYLTIDKEFQDKVAENVQEVLREKKKKRASVVILNPQTGEILTLLSFPTYDNNLFAAGIGRDEYQKLLNNPDKPLFFRAISGEYASGSTIKPVWSAVALQEGIISPKTIITSSGGINIGQWFFPDWKTGGHGPVNVKKAIAESVNTFYYYIGGGYGDFKGIGIDKMNKYAKLFNIGETIGIDLPGESNGLFPSPAWKLKSKDEVWYIGDTYHVSIGQGDLLVTPLQVANWTSFFANGGKIIKPHLVNRINVGDKNIEIAPKIIRDGFIKDEYVKIVKEGMRQGVLTGSSRALNDLPIKASGKTGTAQWRKGKDNHAWWTGFAPYDKPRIVITVLVEEGGEGSRIAVPIAKKIIKWWVDNRMNRE